MEILIVMCMIPVTIQSDYVDIIVTQGRVLDIDRDKLTVDFGSSLFEGGYNMKINTAIKIVNRQNCNPIPNTKPVKQTVNVIRGTK